LGLYSAPKVGKVIQNPYTGTDNLEVMAEAVNYNRFLVDLVLRASGLQRPALDFGAGVGTFAKALVGHGLQVDCLEPDRTQADALEGFGLRVFRDVESVPAEHYGFVYSLNVLEHIEDDRQALVELHRVLRPGGVLLVYVPAFQCLYSSMDRKVGHVRRYHKSELVEKVTAANFRIDEVRHADSIGFAASLAYRYFGSESGKLDHKSVRLYDRIAFPLSLRLDHIVGRWVGKNLVVVAKKVAPGGGTPLDSRPSQLVRN
jgi:SAM-dependent methyltransferase